MGDEETLMLFGGDSMTERERFLATLLGQGADRFPFFDLEPAEETVRRWRREGLPRRKSVAEHFRLETHFPVGLVLRSAPFYTQAPDLLQDPGSFRRHYDPDDPARVPRGSRERAGTPVARAASSTWMPRAVGFFRCSGSVTGTRWWRRAQPWLNGRWR